MKKALLALSALLVSAIPAAAQQTKILTAEKHNEYGLVYSLPTTALQVRVEATREIQKAGPYNQYARRFLGMSDVITEDKVISKVVKVSVTPIGVKDGDTQYLMQFKAGQPVYIGVACDGMLLTVNARPEEQAVDKSDVSPTLRSPDKAAPSVTEYLSYVDQDFVSAQSSLKQAEMLANAIMELRETQKSLADGSADNMPADGRQLEIMLAQLNAQEVALTKAFRGASVVETCSSEYLYIPSENGEEVLCRLSDNEGFVDADDYSGSPLYISTEIVYEGEMPVDPVTGEAKKLPKDAVIYAIPGSARIKLYTSSSSRLYDNELNFPQFGTTFGLDPKLFTDKKSPAYAVFSPVTGALVEIGRMAEQTDQQ